MNFVIVDVETTGGSPKNSKITEIAMYKFNGTEVIDEFSSLVDPEMEIPEFIVRLTGITNDHVKNAPKFYEIAKQIIEFCDDTIFVAHNVSFDYGMFRSEFKNLGYDFRKPHLCTVESARKIIPNHASYSLGKLSRAIGIVIKNRHRAGGDALATTKLFQILYEKDKKMLESFIKEELNPKNIHPNLDMDSIDELPSKVGVYFFYNEFNQVIYIGKSISIKNRVLQHLRNKNSSKAIRMVDEIARVEYELTGSELIALLFESELIKKTSTEI
jgi:DNA polymerase-3 subunit epsilon